MKKILAFGASSSRQSINKRLAKWVGTQVKDVDLRVLDLNDFEMPLYSIDREQEDGVPELAIRFKAAIAEADALVISIAEHNGTYSAAFKNIFDWASRVEQSMWLEKPMILLSTSPGGRGGATALQIAAEKFGYMNAEIIGSLAVPSFNANFSDEEGVIDADLREEVMNLVEQLNSRLAS